MKIEEIQADLFKNIKDRVPVHCISSDYVMGAGIAVPMAKKYNLRDEFNKISPRLQIGKCYIVNNCASLITKDNVTDKPTYNDLFLSLIHLRSQCISKKISKLIMPRIGCGLDQLDWEKVKELIIKVFCMTNIDILVCYI